jgi:hypothetical protein
VCDVVGFGVFDTVSLVFVFLLRVLLRERAAPHRIPQVFPKTTKKTTFPKPMLAFVTFQLERTAPGS